MVPFVRLLFALGVVVLAVTILPKTSHATGLSAAVCEADHNALLAEIKANRERNVAYYEDAMAKVADPDQRDQMATQRDQEWQNEEMQRATALLMLRDCMRHVETLKAKSSG